MRTFPKLPKTSPRRKNHTPMSTAGTPAIGNMSTRLSHLAPHETCYAPAVETNRTSKSNESSKPQLHSRARKFRRTVHLRGSYWCLLYHWRRSRNRLNFFLCGYCFGNCTRRGCSPPPVEFAPVGSPRLGVF